MLQQQKEFEAWGLSKFAVRNIVIFFITSLVTAVIALYRANDQLQQRVVQCEREQAEKIAQLEAMHMQSVQKLYIEMIERSDLLHEKRFQDRGQYMQKSRRK